MPRLYWICGRLLLCLYTGKSTRQQSVSQVFHNHALKTDEKSDTLRHLTIPSSSTPSNHLQGSIIHSLFLLILSFTASVSPIDPLFLSLPFSPHCCLFIVFLIPFSQFCISLFILPSFSSSSCFRSIIPAPINFILPFQSFRSLIRHFYESISPPLPSFIHTSPFLSEFTLQRASICIHMHQLHHICRIYVIYGCIVIYGTFERWG